MTKLSLVLVQGPGKLEGDLDDRLILSPELTPQGHMDVEAYHAASSPWLAWRLRSGAEPRALEIIRIDEGWALQSTSSEDDPIWTFDGSLFRPGELVRLRRPNGEDYLFRIVASETE